MAKFLPQGTTLLFDSVLVGAMSRVSLPDASKPEVEVTDMDSTSKEFLAGLKDNGTVTVECYYDPEDAGQIAMVSNFGTAGNTAVECVITLPAAATTGTSGVATATFDAYVQSVPGDLPAGGTAAATRTFTLRVTGDVTEAIA